MISPRQQYPGLAGLGKVTVPYGGKTLYEAFHPGVDVANTKGTPIKAPVSGVVTKSVGGKVQGDQGYGNFVTIKTANGDQHQLGHLEAPFVRAGQRVQAGQSLVGKMGNSGSAYSPSGQGDGTHLDYRIATAYGRYKNPMLYLKNIS